VIYQLPSGKVINISIESYLRMTDEELRYINDSNFGSSIGNTSPFDVVEDNTNIELITEEYLEELPPDIEFPDDIDFSE
jgi:hypothetical protein